MSTSRCGRGPVTVKVSTHVPTLHPPYFICGPLTRWDLTQFGQRFHPPFLLPHVFLLHSPYLLPHSLPFPSPNTQSLVPSLPRRQRPGPAVTITGGRVGFRNRETGDLPVVSPDPSAYTLVDIPTPSSTGDPPGTFSSCTPFDSEVWLQWGGRRYRFGPGTVP